MIEFHSGRRRVSREEFFRSLQDQAIEAAMNQIEDRVRAVVASILDPETGKHAEAFVRRTCPTELILCTNGSPAFARELERRSDVEKGSIGMIKPSSANIVPHVYLAHASEDHDKLARPFAQALMAKGIEVWFDEWEIRTGNSLRRKMEEGLGS